jgi:hypothetical protein
MSQLSAQLAASIGSERAGVQALVEVLTAERKTLAEGDTDRLSDTAPRKRELLLHISHLGAPNGARSSSSRRPRTG